MAVLWGEDGGDVGFGDGGIENEKILGSCSGVV